MGPFDCGTVTAGHKSRHWIHPKRRLQVSVRKTDAEFQSVRHTGSKRRAKSQKTVSIKKIDRKATDCEFHLNIMRYPIVFEYEKHRILCYLISTLWSTFVWIEEMLSFVKSPFVVCKPLKWISWKKNKEEDRVAETLNWKSQIRNPLLIL